VLVFHRTPELARRQLGGAARGVTCSTVGEAEAMVDAGIVDVFVANDPYHGGGHLPDYNVFAPVFAADADGKRRMVLIASIQCHHGDTGGALAGGYNVFAKDIELHYEPEEDDEAADEYHVGIRFQNPEPDDEGELV
jgi:hypothetical protein